MMSNNLVARKTPVPQKSATYGKDLLSPQDPRLKKIKEQHSKDKNSNSLEDSVFGEYSEVSVLYNFPEPKEDEKDLGFTPEKKRRWQHKYDFKLDPKYHDPEILSSEKILEEEVDILGTTKRVYSNGKKETIIPRLKKEWAFPDGYV